jgi:hypothetical protein
MVKRSVLKAVNVLAVIAIVISWLMPLRTFTQVLLSVGSLAVGLGCYGVLRYQDGGDRSYWPIKPKQ